MLERQVLVPVDADRLWTALTEERSVSVWFGATVRWDLRPGGSASFTEDAGSIRRGVIDDVRVGSLLRFRWWEEGDEPEGTSQVSYELEPADGGTLLRITEAPAPVGSSASGSAKASVGQPSASADLAWTVWDSRLVGVWGSVATLCSVMA